MAGCETPSLVSVSIHVGCLFSELLRPPSCVLDVPRVTGGFAHVRSATRPDRHRFLLDLRTGLPNRRAAWGPVFKTKIGHHEPDYLEPRDDCHRFRQFGLHHASSAGRDGNFGISVHAHRDSPNGKFIFSQIAISRNCSADNRTDSRHGGGKLVRRLDGRSWSLARRLFHSGGSGFGLRGSLLSIFNADPRRTCYRFDGAAKPPKKIRERQSKARGDDFDSHSDIFNVVHRVSDIFVWAVVALRLVAHVSA